MRDDYKNWWAKQSDAGHRYQTEAWFQQNAHELLSLFPRGGTLLDVGCGNAQLLTYLAPHYERVVGIDYSDSMLGAAQERLTSFGIQNVQLRSGDACRLPADIDPVNVILSNQVVQNLKPEEIRLHLRECTRVLAPYGVVGLCGIPWVNLRTAFLSGALQDSLAATPKRRALRRAVSLARYRLSRLWSRDGYPTADHVGLWYTKSQIAEIALSEGFESDFVSSWYYEYRFHARLSMVQ